MWGLRDQEGGWIGAEIANSDGSYDLGPLQINSWWIPKIAAVSRRPERDVRRWLKLNACFNADAARWIFLLALQATGDYWTPVGAFHSPKIWRGRRYALRVVAHLTRRFGAEVFSDRPVGRAPSSGTSTRSSGKRLYAVAKSERTFGFGLINNIAAARDRE